MTDSRLSQLNTFDKDRLPDWLTALLPILLFSWVYYRWPAFWLEVLAVGGYLMAERLLQPLIVLRGGIVSALVTGLLAAFCLPATTPYWPAALVGALAALAAAAPELLSKRWPQSPFSRPLLQPALVGYLLVRAVFPAATGGFAFPVQWRGLDGITAATPLVTEGTEPLSHLFFGIESGSIGGTCEAVVLLGAAYLLLRRRLRLLPAGCMLAVVALFSWIGSGRPLDGLLCGGTLLAALLLADGAYAPVSYADQAMVGVAAGLVTALLRLFTATSGAAAGVLATGLLQPALPSIYRFSRWVWSWLQPALATLWRLVCRGTAWVLPRAKALTFRVVKAFGGFCQGIYKKIFKKEK
ncbi:MAG: RnfABCDGE type electron transport complex subunit D [Clostridia bacterium]|nr:RnfABCDGE type electron transport complex subunit D [Clostridia bacterium]